MTLKARVVRRTDMTTPVAVLDASFGRRWQDQLNAPGSGELTLLNSDDALGLIELGDIVQFLDEDVVRFAFVLRSLESRTIAGTAADETTHLAGPGLLAMLDEALVYPSRGLAAKPIEETRAFSWSSPDYNDSSWETPIALGTVNGPGDGPDWPGGDRAWHQYDGLWPAADTQMIWADSGTTRLAPGGTCYFRANFDVPNDTRARITFVCDDIGDVFIDGGLAIDGKQSGNGADDITATDIDLSAGAHTIAASIDNSLVPAVIDGVDFNPAMLALSVQAISPEGALGYLLIDTGWTWVWKVLAYPPTPPGMTPGEVLLHVIAEAQARGCLTDLGTNFTAAADSESSPWPIVGDISTRVGTDLLTFLTEMTNTYVDLHIDPETYTLNAWQLDGRGTVRDVSLHAPADERDPWSGNLAALTHRRAQ